PWPPGGQPETARTDLDVVDVAQMPAVGRASVNMDVGTHVREDTLMMIGPESDQLDVRVGHRNPDLDLLVIFHAPHLATLAIDDVHADPIRVGRHPER